MALEATSNQNSFEGHSEMSGYFRHFGFKRDPFGVEEKETSFYLLPNWEQQIDLMLHYIRHENVLLTLTGQKGVGKTTLINFFLLEAIHGFSPTETAVQSDLVSGEFLVQSGDTVRTCQVLADNALNPEQMLEAMAGAFEVSTEHFFGSFEHQSEILLESLQYNTQSCVLLIDEAQELPDATLELLLYMINQQSENQHRFHVVLIGESDLKKRLAKMNKAKDYTGLTYSIDLEPLNLSQTEYYLKHRFAAAGVTDEMLFSNGIINKIYKLSGGIPKVINQLARQSLFEILKKNKFSSLGALFKPYKKTLIGGGFLIVSFAMILMYLGQDGRLKSQQHPKTAYHTVIAQKKSVVPVPAPTHLPAISPSTVSSQTNLPAVSPSAPPSQTESTNVVQPKPLVQALPSPQIQAPVASTQPIVQDSTQMAENAQVKAPLILRPQQSIVRDVVKVNPQPLPQNEPLQNLVTSDSAVSKKVSEKKNEHATKSPPQKQSAYTKQLMKKDPAHYTLRFKDMASETASKAFIAKYKPGTNAAWYPVRIQGADKYVVVYGEYANSDTAQRAILFLSKSLQGLEPKPYRIGALQAAVRHAHAQ